MKSKKGDIEKSIKIDNHSKKIASKNSPQTIFVTLNELEFQKKLGEISQKKYTWDELNWLVGKVELELSNSIGENQLRLIDSFPQKISIDLTKIKKDSNNEEICNKVDELSEQGKTLEELQWELAYREYIMDSIDKIA